MNAYKKIGLIAGGGALPHAVAASAREQGYELYIAALTGFSVQEDFDSQHSGQFRLGDVGRLIKTLKSNNVDAICFAGIVNRPDFTAMRPDMLGMKYLPGVIKAATKGDDALLSYVTKVFEKEGITVIGPQDICTALVAPLGVLGDVQPLKEHWPDIEKARHIAKAVGALDIGQGAVVRGGLILAVEAQEGTDGMLSRVKALPSQASENARGGVLAKMLKPDQEARLDLPTLGLTTVQHAIKARLCGIVIEQGGAFIMDKQAVITAANEAGLFIIALDPAPFAPKDHDA